MISLGVLVLDALLSRYTRNAHQVFLLKYYIPKILLQSSQVPTRVE